MTEKDYSGATTSKIGKNAKASSNSQKQTITPKSQTPKQTKDELTINNQNNENSLTQEQISNYKKAGEIAKKIKIYAIELIKPGMPLLEIAEKIEEQIIKQGGEIGFPVDLNIDDITAHYTPGYNDETLAKGLLNVDIGVQIKGCICDFAFSIDLTTEKKHKAMIEASEQALKNAIDLVKQKKQETIISEIGREIQNTIEKAGFIPIVNLSGHSLDEFEIHAGLTIPNIDNSSNKKLGNGAFAIEPFATLSSASGKVYDSGAGNVFRITGKGAVRDSFARQVLEFIIENKKTLPFSQREIVKKFSSRALFALRNLEQAGAIEEYSQLVESSHAPVCQSETSLIIHDGEVEVLC
jgi:methionyl aminopeptidase